MTSKKLEYIDDSTHGNQRQKLMEWFTLQIITS